MTNLRKELVRKGVDMKRLSRSMKTNLDDLEEKIDNIDLLSKREMNALFTLLAVNQNDSNYFEYLFGM